MSQQAATAYTQGTASAQAVAYSRSKRTLASFSSGTSPSEIARAGVLEPSEELAQ